MLTDGLGDEAKLRSGEKVTQKRIGEGEIGGDNLMVFSVYMVAEIVKSGSSVGDIVIKFRKFPLGERGKMERAADDVLNVGELVTGIVLRILRKDVSRDIAAERLVDWRRHRIFPFSLV